MRNIPIALQLYSVRDDSARDFPATLKRVAAMGYEGVEFAGYHDLDAASLREILDGEGLQVAGAHVGLPTLLGDALEETVAFHRELGNRYLIVPGLPEEYRDSADAWRRTADLFNDLAATLRPHGMRTGYHNHTHEFKPMQGQIPWDVFFGATQPEVVMQLDTGNALAGGADPLPFLTRYPGRAATVHLKAYAAGDETALLGEDDVDWQAVFQACERDATTEWYIIEQESYPVSPLESVERCLRNVRAMRREG